MCLCACCTVQEELQGTETSQVTVAALLALRLCQMLPCYRLNNTVCDCPFLLPHKYFLTIKYQVEPVMLNGQFIQSVTNLLVCAKALESITHSEPWWIWTLASCRNKYALMIDLRVYLLLSLFPCHPFPDTASDFLNCRVKYWFCPDYQLLQRETIFTQVKLPLYLRDVQKPFRRQKFPMVNYKEASGLMTVRGHKS